MRLALVVAVGQLVVSSVSAFNTPHSFELSTVVRNIELAGSSAHVTTAYTARSLSKNNDVFYFSIPRRQDEHTSWIEAKLKGSANPLAVDKHGIAALLASTEYVDSNPTYPNVYAELLLSHHLVLLSITLSPSPRPLG